MSFATTKAVRIMAEHESDGIWHVPCFPRDALDDFRVSPGLYARLQRWVRQYWELDRAEYYSGTCDAPGWMVFNIEGHAIAFAVKGELPDWRVFYIDETLSSLGFKLSVPIEIPDRLI